MTETADNGRAAAAEQIAEIREHFPDAEVVDPTSLPGIHHTCDCMDMSGNFRGDDIQCAGCGTLVNTLDYRATILRDLRLMLECDILWLSPGWSQSLGCLIEACAWDSVEPISPMRFDDMDLARQYAAEGKKIAVVMDGFPAMLPAAYILKIARGGK